jgi:hypothetical protein
MEDQASDTCALGEQTKAKGEHQSVGKETYLLVDI